MVSIVSIIALRRRVSISFIDFSFDFMKSIWDNWLISPISLIITRIPSLTVDNGQTTFKYFPSHKY